jgi:precorrin-2 dehydrogenase/sirohydrochlorin ferrochelatase
MTCEDPAKQPEQSSALFPMFLKLTGRSCLVVGAGLIGEAKLVQLLTTGAQIRVVAPEATAVVQQWANEGKIRWERRTFDERHLEGVFLVIVCTSSSSLNSRIFYAAKRHGVLCNVVDAPDLCDFYYPALVRRGDLQIAISTSGRSPALAARIREQLEAQFGPEYEGLLRRLGAIRARLFSRNTDPELRRNILRRIAGRKSSNRILERLSRRATETALR